MNHPEKTENQAAHWVVRLERGLTGAEQDEFLQWLMADPRHGEELARQKTNWSRLNLLADWRPEHAPRPNRDLLTPTAANTRFGFRIQARWFVPAALAAAAAVVFGIFALRPDNGTVMPGAGAPVRSAPARIATIERRTLDDGSVIELNRGAEVAVLYTATERRVRLERGEASFQVAKNPLRPFIVSAGGVDVRAVGTAFNVRLDTAAVEVVVTEGRVAIATPEDRVGRVSDVAFGSVDPNAPERLEDKSLHLSEGQRAVVPLIATPVAEITAVSQEQIGSLLAWQPRLLDFTDSPLHAVVAEFNRHNAPIRLVVADAALADTVVSASLRSDNIEGFIRLLEGGFSVRVERDGNTVTLRKSR